ncbi:hypothetical protein D9Q98_007449 [Chlorella vulgaris]|uniref:Uncharacterized protein n=1 Tax=Chlorella vulgaris TaxID=3077 RepID=A0A9D4TL67_CHLVU|nr:hypothetical protein D9Q98_007449 [Chlorella vulgaris]
MTAAGKSCCFIKRQLRGACALSPQQLDGRAAALPDQTEPQTEQQPAPVQAEQPQSAQEPAAPQPEQDAAQQAEAARRKEVEQLWREIQLLALRAENLEASGRYDEAAELLSAAIARLQTRPHDDLDMVPLRQLLWDMLHAAGRYEEALAQAQAVHEAITAAYGVGSAEAHLVAVRLGISSAACDQPGPALRLIHDAVRVLEHNLGGMLERGQELAAAAAAEGASEENQQELEVLQRAIDKVAAAMGEGNFYGGLITMHFAAQEGQQQGVINGWEELESLIIHGFCGIMAAEAAVQAGNMLHTALRDHDGLTEALSDDPLLGRLVKQQNERVHDAAKQGLDHPLLQ